MPTTVDYNTDHSTEARTSGVETSSAEFRLSTEVFTTAGVKPTSETTLQTDTDHTGVPQTPADDSNLLYVYIGAGAGAGLLLLIIIIVIAVLAKRGKIKCDCRKKAKHKAVSSLPHPEGVIRKDEIELTKTDAETDDRNGQDGKHSIYYVEKPLEGESNDGEMYSDVRDTAPKQTGAKHAGKGFVYDSASDIRTGAAQPGTAQYSLQKDISRKNTLYASTPGQYSLQQNMYKDKQIPPKGDYSLQTDMYKGGQSGPATQYSLQGHPHQGDQSGTTAQYSLQGHLHQGGQSGPAAQYSLEGHPHTGTYDRANSQPRTGNKKTPHYAHPPHGTLDGFSNPQYSIDADGREQITNDENPYQNWKGPQTQPDKSPDAPPEPEPEDEQEIYENQDFVQSLNELQPKTSSDGIRSKGVTSSHSNTEDFTQDDYQNFEQIKQYHSVPGGLDVDRITYTQSEDGSSDPEDYQNVPNVLKLSQNVPIVQKLSQSQTGRNPHNKHTGPARNHDHHHVHPSGVSDEQENYVNMTQTKQLIQTQQDKDHSLYEEEQEDYQNVVKVQEMLARNPKRISTHSSDSEQEEYQNLSANQQSASRGNLIPNHPRPGLRRDDEWAQNRMEPEEIY